jgi:NAD(P)H-flavin reductase
MHTGDLVDIEDSSGSCSGKATGGQAPGACLKCPRHRKRWGNQGMNFVLDENEALSTAIGGSTAAASSCVGESWVKDASVDEYQPRWSLPVYATQIDTNGYLWVSTAPIKGSVSITAASTKKKDKGEKSAKGGEANAEAAPAPAAAPALQLRAAPAEAATTSNAAAERWIPATITAVTQASHNSFIYRVSAPADTVTAVNGRSKWPADRHSWHVNVCLDDPLAHNAAAAEPLCREYTPVSDIASWERNGTLDLLIKLYADGKLTSRFLRLHQPTATGGSGGVSWSASGSASASAIAIKPDTKVWVSQPSTTLVMPHILPPGDERIDSEAAAVKATGPGRGLWGPGSAVALVAGGTGLTPMLQVAEWALRSDAKKEEVPEMIYLLISNRTQGDILLRERIARLTKLSGAGSGSGSGGGGSVGGRLRVLHTLTDTNASSEGSTIKMPYEQEEGVSVEITTGRVNAAMLRSFLPAPAAVPATATAQGQGQAQGRLSLRRIVISGPEGMMTAAHEQLIEAGYPEDIIVELDA